MLAFRNIRHLKHNDSQNYLLTFHTAVCLQLLMKALTPKLNTENHFGNLTTQLYNKLELFEDIINARLDCFLPAKTVKLHEKDKTWVTPEFKKIIEAGQKAFQKVHIIGRYAIK